MPINRKQKAEALRPKIKMGSMTVLFTQDSSKKSSLRFFFGLKLFKPIREVVRSLNNALGQATLEYLLLIVIVIAIALGIGGPLGRHLRDFSGALLGPEGYYACLTERAILPGESSECGQSVDLAMGSLSSIQSGEGFDSKWGPGGSRFAGSSTSGSAGGDPSSFSSSSSKSGDGSSSESGDSSSEESGDSSGGADSTSALSGDQSRSPKRHRLKSGPSSTGSSASSLTSSDLSPESFLADSGSDSLEDSLDNDEEGSDSQDQGLGGFDSKQGSYKKSRFRVSQKQSEGYLGTRLYDEEAEDKEVFKAKGPGLSDSSESGEIQDSKVKSDLSIKKADTKDKQKIKRFNFLSFIKYFLIGALIILLLAMIFSQVMEYQSRD